MYATAIKYTGNLGGRAGADQIAEVNLPDGLTGKTVRAFISVDANDCIRNMPSNYNFPADIPIVNADATHTIATNWADLLDGSNFGRS